MIAELDHILWGAPDLEAGEQSFTSLTAVMPVRGGSHPGQGTRNSLVSLGQGAYLEIISTDPMQSCRGRRAQRVEALKSPAIIGFAARSSDLEEIARIAIGLGLHIDGPHAKHRETPAGIKIEWRVLDILSSGFDPVLPFFIDWGGSPHPSAQTPQGCRLANFTVYHPLAMDLMELYGRLAITCKAEYAPVPGFLALLETPNGPVELR